MLRLIRTLGIILSLAAVTITPLSAPAYAQEEEPKPQSVETTGPVTYPQSPDSPSDITIQQVACTVVSDDPVLLSGPIVEGHGRQTCTAYVYQQIEVCVQRHRWYGWETMACDVASNTTVEIHEWTQVLCASGTYTYRTRVKGWFTWGGRTYSSPYVYSYNKTYTC